MNNQPSHSALNIEGISWLGSFVPGATIGHRATQRERRFAVRCTHSQFALSCKFIAFIFGAIGQLQRKIAELKTAVVRRYNKGQQSDGKLSAPPPVCSRCAWRYVYLKPLPAPSVSQMV